MISPFRILWISVFSLFSHWTSPPDYATIKLEKQRIDVYKRQVLILRDLMQDTRRFGELKRSIGHISQKVLTANLRAMEQSLSLIHI